MKIGAIILMLCGTLPVPAPEPIMPYRLEQGSEELYLLPIEQYKNLTRDTARPPEAPSPVRDTVLECEAVVTLQDGWARVELTGTLDLAWSSSATGSGSGSAPETFRTLPLLTATGPVVRAWNGPGTLALDDGNHTLLTMETGRHPFRLEYSLPVASEHGRSTLDLHITEAARQKILVTIPAKYALEVSSADLSLARQDFDGKETRLELYGRGTGAARLTWESSVKARERESYSQAETASHPELSSTVLTAVTATEDYLRARSRVLVQVRKNPVEELRLSLPPKAEVIDVTGGPKLREWVEEEGAAHTVIIRLEHAIQEDLDITVEYEQPLSGATPFLPVSVQDAYHEQHEVGFRSPSNVMLKASPAESWKALDAAACSREFQALIEDSLARSFQVEVFPSSTQRHRLDPIAIEIGKLEQEALMQATIDLAQAVMKITQEGHLLGKVDYQIKNNSQQFLRVRLPPGHRVLTVFVGLHAVRAAREGDDTVLIPLARSGQTPAGAVPFNISITYYQRLDPLSAEKPIQLELPKVDLSISTLRWELGLPDGWELVPLGGNVRPDTEYRPVVFEGGEGAPVTAGTNATALFQDATLPLVVPLPMGFESFHFSRDLIEAEADAPPTVILRATRSTPGMVLRALSFLMGLVLFYVLLRRRADIRSRWIITGLGLVGSALVVAFFPLATPLVGFGLHLALGIFTGILMFGMTRLIRREEVSGDHPVEFRPLP